MTHHVGNRRLQVLVEIYIEKYANANKIVKGTIVSNIIETIRGATSFGGGFVKQIASGAWVEVGCSFAREKVGQIFRELLARRNPEKIQSRKERRKQLRARRARTPKSASSCTGTVPITTKDSCRVSIVSCDAQSKTRPPTNHTKYLIVSNNLNTNLREFGSFDLGTQQDRFLSDKPYPQLSLIIN